MSTSGAWLRIDLKAVHIKNNEVFLCRSDDVMYQPAILACHVLSIHVAYSGATEFLESSRLYLSVSRSTRCFDHADTKHCQMVSATTN